MAVSIASVHARSKSRTFVLPYIGSFPAAWKVQSQCTGAQDHNGCFDDMSISGVTHTWSASGTLSGTTACGGFAPPTNVSWSVAWSASVSSIGDNGDGTWRYQLSLTMTPTNCTIGTPEFYLQFGSTVYHDGDYIDVPYLNTISTTLGGPQVTVSISCSGGTVSAGAQAAYSTGSFTAYGFANWSAAPDYAASLFNNDDRWEIGDDTTLSSYCTDPTALTGEVTARRMEWRAFITGGTPFDNGTDVYFHLEHRVRGSGGSWTSAGSYSVTPILDANGNAVTEWVVDELVSTYEVRLKNVDFTP